MGTLQDELKKNGKKVENVVNNPLNLRIPTIKKVEVTAEQDAIDKAVAGARQYIADIPGHMAGLVSRIQAIQGTSSEERAIRSKELKDLEEEVLAHLGAEDKLLGEAARQAYVMATIATLLPDEQAILAAIDGNSRLPGLLALGVLSGADDKKNTNIVKVFGKIYAVNSNKATEIVHKIRKVVGEAYGNKIAEIKAKATISVAELLAGKSGRVFINAPDEKINDRFLPGGVLLVQSDGKVIRVVEFLGHFQQLMPEITEAGTFFPVDSLNRERLELAKRLSDDKFRKARILHAVLRRGVATELACQKPSAPVDSKSELAQMPATLSAIGVSEDRPLLH